MVFRGTIICYQVLFCLCINPVVDLTSSLPLLPHLHVLLITPFPFPSIHFPFHFHMACILLSTTIPLISHPSFPCLLNVTFLDATHSHVITDRQTDRCTYVCELVAEIYMTEYALFLFITLVTSSNILFRSTHFRANCTIYLSLQLHKILSCMCTFSLSIHLMERSPLPWLGLLQDLGIDWLDGSKATVNKTVFLISWYVYHW